MTKIACFMLQPAPVAAEELRRYCNSAEADSKCPGRFGYHNARAPLGFVPWSSTMHGKGADDFDHAASQWPKVCAGEGCTYVFKATDQWQHNTTQLWRRVDTGEVALLEDFPPGAMWDADWLHATQAGPDGVHLMVRTPGGDWRVDGPDGWTRTGTLPKVTASPSILFNGQHGPYYHGHLVDGVLVECA